MFYFNIFVEIFYVNNLNLDIVIIVIGGLLYMDVFSDGNDFVVFFWDILVGDVKFGCRVFVYDDVGDYLVLQVVEMIVKIGVYVEIMMLDWFFVLDVMVMNLVFYMCVLQDKDVWFIVIYCLKVVKCVGNKLVVVIGMDYFVFIEEWEFDQIVVNYGMILLDDFYFELKLLLMNLGWVDQEVLIFGCLQLQDVNFDGLFVFYCIGDVVLVCNMYVVVYDVLCLMKDI